MPQVVQAIALAVPMGLRVPIVYNTRCADGRVEAYYPFPMLWVVLLIVGRTPARSSLC